LAKLTEKLADKGLMAALVSLVFSGLTSKSEDFTLQILS